MRANDLIHPQMIRLGIGRESVCECSDLFTSFSSEICVCLMASLILYIGRKLPSYKDLFAKFTNGQCPRGILRLPRVECVYVMFWSCNLSNF